MIPANLILRLVADILDARSRRLEQRVRHNRRGPNPSAAVGRQAMVEQLRRQVDTLRRMKATGEVSAARAGLLLAWAGDWSGAIPLLEDECPALVDVRGEDIVGACRRLLVAREG